MQMSKRRYRQHKRAQAVEEKRLSVIEAARRQLSQDGYYAVSLDEIAQEAGVSRQTIYVQFGSKRGLLQSLAEHIERESYGSDIVEGAHDTHDPASTIRNGIADQMAFFAKNASLLRTFQAQSASDPDIRAVWQDRRRERLVAIRILVEQIAERGRLHPDWTINEASDWLWSLTNFERYDEMVIERGWAIDRVVQRLREAVDQVISPPGA
jgi:AcrR family transcriptional regulator